MFNTIIMTINKLSVYNNTKCKDCFCITCDNAIVFCHLLYNFICFLNYFAKEMNTCTTLCSILLFTGQFQIHFSLREEQVILSF